jgi:hypothetical protein
MKRVVVVSGALGVGKSEALRSMREALSDLVKDVAVLDSDQFYMMIDPHWTLPPARVDRYFEVSGWLLRQTAMGFLSAGFDWVAIASNGLWSEAHVRDFVRPFATEGADVHHMTLDPGDSEVRRQVMDRSGASGDERNTKDVDEAMHMLSRVRSCSGSWTHVIDNAALTPMETAQAIYEAVAAGFGRL